MNNQPEILGTPEIQAPAHKLLSALAAEILEWREVATIEA